tara:strand:+ start:709 stop:897 length:189 start_codon:yes stop_codon:yes gene_type:complete
MKNIITNIAGFVIVGLSIYALLRLELEVVKFSLLTVLGLALVYFENSTIKEYLRKALDKILK